MTSERTTTNYSDADIQAVIESYPLVDSEGYSPDQDSWTPTYDLNSAAADIWEEKAGSSATKFDFSADGASYDRSQIHEMAMKQARYYRSRRSAKAIELESSPKYDDLAVTGDSEV
jgi:hypothetical protein